MIKNFIILFLVIFAWAKDVQIVNGYEYSPPKGLTFLTSFPNDLQEYGKLTFRKEKINEWLVISSLTGIMIAYDEPLIFEAKKIGNSFNLTNEDNTTEFFSIFEQLWKVFPKG